MKTPKKLPTIRLLLLGMKRDLELLRLRIGSEHIQLWEEKTQREQD